MLSNDYHQLRLTNKKNIREAKINYEQNLANRSKKEPKLIYAYVKSKFSVKNKIRALKDNNSNINNDPSSMATILNKRPINSTINSHLCSPKPPTVLYQSSAYRLRSHATKIRYCVLFQSIRLFK